MALIKLFFITASVCQLALTQSIFLGHLRMILWGLLPQSIALVMSLFTSSTHTALLISSTSLCLVRLKLCPFFFYMCKSLNWIFWSALPRCQLSFLICDFLDSQTSIIVLSLALPLAPRRQLPWDVTESINCVFKIGICVSIKENTVKYNRLWYLF